MKLRAARAEDLPPLARDLARLPLLIRYARPAGALTLDLERALERGDGLVLAEDERGRRVGLAWFTPAGTLGMGGYLRLIAVVPGAGRQGIGRTLLGAFEAATAPLSRHAFLLVSESNREDRRFYEPAGYLQVGRLPDLLLPGTAELLYWKRLAAV